MKTKKIDNFFTKLIIFLMIIIVLSFIESELNKSMASPVEGVLEVYYFDVGEADSILIRDSEHSMLIDAGNETDGVNLSNYIKSDISLSKLDIVVGTHPHEDHIGGLDDIINTISVSKVYLPNVTTTTKTFTNLLDSIENNNLKITVPNIDDTFDLGDMKFKVISVGSDESNLNDSSIVLRLDYGSTSFLFTGDISKSVEKNIIDKDIDVDVLKVAHHGSNYSSSINFLDKVSPKYAIILVGNNNKYKHPSSTVLKRLENIDVYRTDRDGTIKITSDGKNLTIDKIQTSIDG